MRWKQFFTPVESMGGPETHRFLEKLSGDDYNLIDVRQPGEYANGHLPGAKLIPLGDLSDRARELDPDKPTVVY